MMNKLTNSASYTYKWYAITLLFSIITASAVAMNLTKTNMQPLRSWDTLQVVSHDTKIKENSMALTTDGNLIITCGRDGTIKLWDFKTGKLKKTLTDKSSHKLIACMIYENSLLVGTNRGTVKKWDLLKGNLDWELPVSEDIRGAVQSLGVNIVNNKKIVAYSDIWDVYLLDWDTGDYKWNSRILAKKYESQLHTIDLVNPVLSSYRDQLAVGFLSSVSKENSLQLWRINHANLKFDEKDVDLIGLPLSNGIVSAVAFNSYDGQFLAAAFVGDDQQDHVDIWRVGPHGIMRDKIKSYNIDKPQILAWHSLGKYLAIAGTDNIVTVINIKTDQGYTFALPNKSQRIRSIIFHPDGKHIITRSSDGKVSIWANPFDEGLEQNLFKQFKQKQLMGKELEFE